MVVHLDAIQQRAELGKLVALEKLHFVVRVLVECFSNGLEIFERQKNEESMIKYHHISIKRSIDELSRSALHHSHSSISSSMVRVSTPRLSTGPQLRGAHENSERIAGGNAPTAPASPSSSLALLRPEPMARTEFFSYSMGHIMNDMMASCWFSYLLVYLTKTPDIALHSEGAAVRLDSVTVWPCANQ